VSRGPALLVLTQIFASNRMLLLKRGLEPYRGKWAPPGGFVEGGESLEAAALREIREEVGIELERTQLLPHAVVSVPKINQVYHIFIARLDEIVPASAVPPESLEVGWFSERDLASLEIWDPGADVDTMRGYALRVDARKE
jgi:8-oxo-dGTP diphosphatase